MLTIEAKEVEQSSQGERVSYIMGWGWPIVGRLPEDLERLQNLEKFEKDKPPPVVKYPLGNE